MFLCFPRNHFFIFIVRTLKSLSTFYFRSQLFEPEYQTVAIKKRLFYDAPQVIQIILAEDIVVELLLLSPILHRIFWVKQIKLDNTPYVLLKFELLSYVKTIGA